MKRMWIALALLCAVAVVCGLSVWHQHRQADVLLTQLDSLEAAYRGGHIQECQQLTQQLTEQYAVRTALLPLYLSHQELQPGREVVAALPAFLEQNPEEFLPEVARLRQHLLWLRQIDTLTLRNVF